MYRVASPISSVGYALGGGLATMLLIGVPTALLPTPWFGREIPPRPLDWVFLILTALLCAALAVTYALPVACPTRERSLTAGGFLSFLAIGCPVCNKLAVLALGWGGALTYFAPFQPLLGALALVLLAVTLVARLRAVRLALALACAAPRSDYSGAK
jgi:hypothetical protein